MLSYNSFSKGVIAMDEKMVWEMPEVKDLDVRETAGGSLDSHVESCWTVKSLS